MLTDLRRLYEFVGSTITRMISYLLLAVLVEVGIGGSFFGVAKQFRLLFSAVVFATISSAGRSWEPPWRVAPD